MGFLIICQTVVFRINTIQYHLIVDGKAAIFAGENKLNIYQFYNKIYSMWIQRMKSC